MFLKHENIGLNYYATKIQSIFRGYFVRLQLKKFLSLRRKLLRPPPPSNQDKLFLELNMLKDGLNHILKKIDNLESQNDLESQTKDKIDKYNNSYKINNQISIENILENNRLEDLERFIDRRKCFNKWNIYMIYIFHFIQSSGILLCSVGATLNIISCLWVGISLNTIASILQIYEKVNDSQLKKMYKDIVLIKENKYICEIEAIEPVHDTNALKSLSKSVNYRKV